MGRFIAYTRFAVSASYQGKGGPVHQLAECEAYAARHGVELAGLFTDHGIPGGTRPMDRPGFLDLSRAVQVGDVVLVSRLDRLGRSPLEIHEAVTAIRKAGGVLHSIATDGAEVFEWIMECVEGMADFLRRFEQLEQLIIRERKIAEASAGSSGAVEGLAS